MSDVSRSLQIWVLNIQSVVLTAVTFFIFFEELKSAPRRRILKIEKQPRGAVLRREKSFFSLQSNNSAASSSITASQWCFVRFARCKSVRPWTSFHSPLSWRSWARINERAAFTYDIRMIGTGTICRYIGGCSFRFFTSNRSSTFRYPARSIYLLRCPDACPVIVRPSTVHHRYHYQGLGPALLRGHYRRT